MNRIDYVIEMYRWRRKTLRRCYPIFWALVFVSITAIGITLHPHWF